MRPRVASAEMATTLRGREAEGIGLGSKPFKPRVLSILSSGGYEGRTDNRGTQTGKYPPQGRLPMRAKEVPPPSSRSSSGCSPLSAPPGAYPMATTYTTSTVPRLWMCIVDGRALERRHIPQNEMPRERRTKDTAARSKRPIP